MATKSNGAIAPEVAPPTVRLGFAPAEQLTLPSGTPVLAVRADGLRLARFGGDIGVMQGLAAKLARDTADAPDAGGGDDLSVFRDREARDGYFMMLDAYARACLLRPRVVEAPEQVRDREREVWIEEIPDLDKQYLMTWSQGGEAAEEAAAFLDDAGAASGGAAAGVDALPDGDGAGAAAERPDGAAA